MSATEPNPRGFDIVTDRVSKPLNDTNEYLVGRLENGLEFMVVCDPSATRACCCMNVGVGYFSDEKPFYGAAHLLEHAYMDGGSNKFPATDTLYIFSHNNGGTCDAETMRTCTRYHAVVPAQAFPGALDRLANTFMEPCFDEDALEGIPTIIASEHETNLRSDVLRIRQLHWSLANPKHPISGFGTGNLHTLEALFRTRGASIRETVIQTHEKWCSANLMKLVVIGPHSVKEQCEMVVAMCAGIPNKEVPRNAWHGIKPYEQDQLQKLIFVKPVKKFDLIDLRFPFADDTLDDDSQSAKYVEHLISHNKGPGSISAYLRARKLALKVDCGVTDICSGSATFFTTIVLTAEGVRGYKEVVKAFFQYISVLLVPQERIYKEIAHMHALNFHNEEKEPALETAKRLSSAMQLSLPREHLLSGQKLLLLFNAEKIKRAIASLTPEMVRITLISQDVSQSRVLREKWYGTKYSIESIPEDFLKTMREALISTQDRPKDLHLPTENLHLPSNLNAERKSREQPLSRPHLILQNNTIKIWYQENHMFRTPRVNLNVILRSPLCSKSASTLASTILYERLVQHALVEEMSAAEIAGLSYNIEANVVGIELKFQGYTENMSIFVEKVVKILRHLEVNEGFWETVKSRLISYYKIKIREGPVRTAYDHRRWLSEQTSFTDDQLLAEILSLAIDDMYRFPAQLFDEIFTEVLIFGELDRKGTQELAHILEEAFRPGAPLAAEYPVCRNFILAKGANFQYNHTLEESPRKDSCIQYVLQIGESRHRRHVASARLFAQLNAMPAFSQLRTKDNLGYGVYSNFEVNTTMAVYHIAVQTQHPLDYVEARIEHMLCRFPKILEGLSLGEFEERKRGIKDVLLHEAVNLNEETDRKWKDIKDGTYLFDRDIKREVQELESITLDDLREFWERYINPNGGSRAKLVLRIHAKSATPINGALSGDTGMEEVCDASTAPVQSQIVCSSHGVGSSENQTSVTAQKPTVIEDVRAFQETLRVTEGARKARHFSNLAGFDIE